MTFFTFDPNRFDDNKYAYAEPIEPINYCSANVCPKCGRYTSHLKWLPPRNIKLSKATFGDFTFGSFEYFLVSDRFVEMYKISSLSGIVTFESIHCVKGPTKNAPIQNLSLAVVDQGSAIIDEKRSQIKRIGSKMVVLCEQCYTTDPPWYEINGFELKGDSWDEKDIFVPKGGLRSICFTAEFVAFCLKNKFTNFRYIPTADYKILLHP